MEFARLAAGCSLCLLAAATAVRHPRPVAFKRQIAPGRLEGKEVRFESSGGDSHSAYKRADSVTMKGTLERIGGGQLVVRSRDGRSIALTIDDGMKVLVQK